MNMACGAAKNIACKTEEEIYATLGLITLSRNCAPTLVKFRGSKTSIAQTNPHGSLKGDLQTQTNWTDGEFSIEKMARAAIAEKLEYIAITDHTKSLGIAHGLDEKQLEKQGREIDALNVKFKKKK